MVAIDTVHEKIEGSRLIKVLRRMFGGRGG